MSRMFRWLWAGSAAVAWLVPAVLSPVLPAEARAGSNPPSVKRSALLADSTSVTLARRRCTGILPAPITALKIAWTRTSMAKRAMHALAARAQPGDAFIFFLFIFADRASG